MYVSLTATMPNDAVATIHRIAAIETDYLGTVTVRVNSFVDISAELVLWQEIYEISSSVTESGTYPDNVYAYLIGVTGPLNGGTLVDEVIDDLPSAQLLKWLEVKNKRDEVEFGGCDSPLGLVDTDEKSQQRVSSTLAFSNAVGPSFGVGWTMADDGVVWHNRFDFSALALAVGQHVSNAHSRAQSLRSAIYALTTIEAVDAFDVALEWDELSLLTEGDDVLISEAGLDLVA